MANEVLIGDWTPGRRLWLKTPGRSSLDVAIGILRWLEGLDGCSIPDASWRCAGHGNLSENGIAIRLGTIRFSIMCSYDDLFIDRIAGNNGRFTALCEVIQQAFATT